MTTEKPKESKPSKKLVPSRGTWLRGTQAERVTIKGTGKGMPPGVKGPKAMPPAAKRVAKKDAPKKVVTGNLSGLQVGRGAAAVIAQRAKDPKAPKDLKDRSSKTTVSGRQTW